MNNLIEQDHRSIKLRLGPMLGLKRFRTTASITIAGIELAHRIRKGQFKLGTLRKRDPCARNLERGARCMTSAHALWPFVVPSRKICTTTWQRSV
ncbi:DDE-type integrase/transposase/recombinase (plasmid) [Methylocystis sp. MJC1]|nr:DDE-type integrase/transposase/recombinase [Methylocystis sp. MJC1]